MVHSLIRNACHIEVLAEYNNFTDDQKKHMIQLLNRFENTKSTNIYKFTKTLKAFEDAFIANGGNHDKLKESITKIRDEQYITSSKLVPGLKIVKEGE